MSDRQKQIAAIKGNSKPVEKKGGVNSPTSSKTATETSTKTSTDAYTQGNITVTGGAGKGATNVTIQIPRGEGGDPARRAKDSIR